MKRSLLLVTFIMLVNIISAQSIDVNGLVKDELGEPIIGATIQIKNTQTGTTTSLDGTFKLRVPSRNSRLVISFIGYETMEVVAKERLVIEMKPSSVMIDEVVVTGMTKMDKRLFTGASNRLAAEDVKLSGMADISRSLEGRAAGVSVQNVSATFGTAPKIRVRGATSILGTSKPLWVVDGVIVEDVTEVSPTDLSSGDAVTMISSAIAGLNAEDIESFNILKDGSATSIYGAKAMAGVIVITTKKGREGATRLSYSGEFTTRLKPNYAEYNIMNSQDQMSVFREMQSKGFLNLAETLRAQHSGIYGRMYSLINRYDETSGQFGLPYTEKAMNDYLRVGEYRNTDWFDELFSNSIMMNHSISMSTGTAKSTSYLSLSFMDDPGWYKQSGVKRYTFNANTSYKLSDKVSFTAHGNASYRKQFAPGTLTQETDDVFGTVSRKFDINPFYYGMNTSRTMAADESYTRNYAAFNVIEELNNNYIRMDVIDAKFQGELSWTIIPGLNFNSLASFRYVSSSNQHFIRDNSNQARAYREMGDAVIRDKNPYLYKDPDAINSLPVSILPDGGIYEKREYKTSSYSVRNSLTWNKTLNDIHIMHAYGGMEITSVKRTNDWFRGWGMQYDEGEIPFYNYLAFKKTVEDNKNYYSLSNTTRKTAAFFGMLNYSYKGKYNLNGTIRYEGTNRLGKSTSSRWLPTWNVGAAWNVHEEEFFESLKPTLSHLNVKASYSLTADAGPDYISNSVAIIKNYNAWRPSAGDRESGLMIDKLGNDGLTYEKKHELNLGLSVGLLDNRINLETDFYTRNNYDLLGIMNTQGAGGEIRKYANIADMKSKGVEFTLSTRNVEIDKFRWTTDLTFSWSKHKITDLKSDANILNLIVGTGCNLQGYAPYSLFSIPFEGLDSEGFPIYKIGDKTYTKDNYSDINFQSTHEADLNSLKYEGPTDPVYTGGFGNIFTYKRFRLNVFMTYGFGNSIRLNTVFKARYNDFDAMPNEFKNRWMVAGNENQTNVPVIASVREINNYQESALRKAYSAYNYTPVRVAKGDFIRMKEISLTYDFARELARKISLSDLSLKIQVTNPFLIYAHSSLNGQDPEYYQAGGVSSPLAKQITFTVRMGL